MKNFTLQTSDYRSTFIEMYASIFFKSFHFIKVVFFRHFEKNLLKTLGTFADNKKKIEINKI